MRAPFRLLLLFAPLASLCGAPALRAGDAPGVDLQLSPSVEQYALQEIRFKVPGKVDNPYNSEEIAVEGHFATPSGRPLKLPAFYRQAWDPLLNEPGGDEGWLLRFTPTEVGNYEVLLFISHGGGAAKEVAKAAFDCTPSQRSGFVRADGKRFTLTTGGIFLPIGANRCWGDLREPKQYLDDLDKLSAAGANCVRVWLAPWWLPIESKAGSCDQRASALLDLVLSRAEADHLKVILCIQQHGNFEPEGREVARWNSNPYNAAKGGPCKTVSEFFTNPVARRLFRDRLRYLVARWGCSTSLMAWELFNEVEWIPFEDGGYREHEKSVLRWHIEMARFLRVNDPFRHLVATSSDVDLQRKLVDHSGADFVDLHIYDKGNLAKRVGEEVAPLADELSVPVMVEEFGGPDDQDGRFVTRGILSAVFSGAAGALPWLQDRADTAPCYRRLGVARRFLDAARAAAGPMLPAFPEIVRAGAPVWQQAHALHATALVRDDLALAYFYEWPPGMAVSRSQAASSPFRLLIPGVKEGDFAAETWDCSTGAVIQRQTLRSDASAQNPPGGNPGTLPLDAAWSGEDLALKITRQPAAAH